MKPIPVIWLLRMSRFRKEVSRRDISQIVITQIAVADRKCENVWNVLQMTQDFVVLIMFRSPISERFELWKFEVDPKNWTG